MAIIENTKTSEAISLRATPSVTGDTTIAELQNIPVDYLQSTLRKYWERALRAKSKIEQRMLNALRAVNGEYSSEKLTALEEVGSTTIYMMITAQKVRDAKAWIYDILEAGGDRPWSVEPTPSPDIPSSKKIEAEKQAVKDIYNAANEFFNQTGLQVSLDEINEIIDEHKRELSDKIYVEIMGKARNAAERMTIKIDDQLVEGAWKSAFRDFIQDIIIYPAGFLKCPVLRKKQKKEWTNIGGKWHQQTTDAIVLEFDRISPFDIYPEPDASSLSDGYLFEKHRLTRQDLYELIGVKGYKEDAIREVLKRYDSGGYKEWLAINSEREAIEQKTSNVSTLTGSDKIDAIQFFGNISGKILKEWGMEGIEDEEREYAIEAWIVADIVIKAILNPDLNGVKPYIKVSWDIQPGAFWGIGVPEIISDTQEQCNAAARAIVNNESIASGPQIEVNTERIEGETSPVEIWPWKVWLVNGKMAQEGPAIKFTNVPMIAAELIGIYNKFKSDSDDQSGIPSYVHGSPQARGAGATASGLSMLLSATARGIKYVMTHIDDAIGEVIRRLYDFNMLYDDDETIKGDLMVRARGSSALIAKEQLALRRNEFLNSVVNFLNIQDENGMGIVTPTMIKILLREQAKSLELPDIVRLFADVKSQLPSLASGMASQGMPPMGGGEGRGMAPPAMPPEMLPGGTMPAGGREANLFAEGR